MLKLAHFHDKERLTEKDYSVLPVQNGNTTIGINQILVLSLGFGCLWAWIHCLIYGNLVATDMSQFLFSLRIGNSTAATITLCIGGLFAKKISRILKTENRSLLALLGIAGTVISIALFSCESNLFWIAQTCSILMGIGTALMTLLWGQALLNLPDARQLGAQIASFGIISSFVIYVLISNTTQPFTLLFIAPLPCLSSLGIAYASRLGIGAQQGKSSTLVREKRNKFDSTVIVHLLVFGIVLGVVNVELTRENQAITGFVVVAAIVVSAVLMALVSSRARNLLLDSLNRIILPLMSIGFLMVTTSSVSGSNLAGSILVITGYCLVDIFSWVACMEQAGKRPSGVAAIYSFSIGQFAKSLGLAIGIVVGIGSSGFLTDWAPVIFLGIFILLIIFSSYPNPLHSDAQTPWENAHDRTLKDLLDAASLEASSLLSSQFGLTERETEVCALAIKGKSTESISRELCISVNTAKAHRRSIYSKIGVHSQEELLELVFSLQEANKE